jgi:hypothetical protein
MALEFTDEEFKRIRQRAEDQYRLVGSIRCPYFGEPVFFNSEGFRHFLFKSWNRGRDQHDQFMRLKHFVRAPEILRLSRTVQGIQSTQEWERRHKYGRWEHLLVSVTYYQFVAVLENRRFKVIVKQLPDGVRIFWSLIPFWRQTKNGVRIIHDGNPAEE